MDTIKTIAGQRSIRKFKNTLVTDETILNAAVQASSGKNRQPWRFIVVREGHQAEMVRVRRLAGESGHRYRQRQVHGDCDGASTGDRFCVQSHQMIAAVSFGYSDGQPGLRPRKPVSEVTTWL